jgi:hypothetical protein
VTRIQEVANQKPIESSNPSLYATQSGVYTGDMVYTLSPAKGLGAGSTRPFFVKVPYGNEKALPADRQLLAGDTVAMSVLISISHLTLFGMRCYIDD